MKASIYGFVLDCEDADFLADFYAKLLEWEKTVSTEEWAAVQSPQGLTLAFQSVDGYVPPVWPFEVGKQQQMAHIDFIVDNLDEAVEHAISCGAKKSATQFFETSVVLFDPSGHPFCLVSSE